MGLDINTTLKFDFKKDNREMILLSYPVSSYPSKRGTIEREIAAINAGHRLGGSVCVLATTGHLI